MSKVIDFQAKADGVYTAMEKIQAKSKAMFDNEVENARKYSKLLKDQIQQLNEKARALEKNARANSQSTTSYVKENSGDFNTTKKKRLDEISQEQEEVRQSKELLEETKRKKKITPEQYKRDLSEINLESTALSKEKAGLIGKTIKDTDEYKSLKEIEKASKLTASGFRESVNKTQQQGKDLTKAIFLGDEEVADQIRETAPNKTLVEQLAQKELEDKKKRESGSDDSGFGKLFSGLGLLKTLDHFVKTAASFTNSKNGFDEIASFRSTEGQLIGSVVGGAIGALISGGTGAGIGAGIGSSILGTVFGAEGSLEQRGALGREQLSSNLIQYRALTGKDYGGISDQSQLGIDSSQQVQLRTQTATSRGTSLDAERQTNLAIFYEKGFGVQQQTSQTLQELLRSSSEGNRDVGNILGGILKQGQGNLFKGGDRTFFNEFLSKNFTTIQRELLKSQSTVATGTTFDILKRFNSVGGEFSARDSRSTGLISTINNSLSNPGGEIAKALTFNILRQMHPDYSVEKLLEERQKGIGSAGYLQGVRNRVTSIGGSEDSQILNFAGLTGLSNNLKFARDLYKKGDFSNLSQSELVSGQKDSDLQKLAEANTTQLEKNTANISQEILKGATQGAAAIKKAIQEALDHSSIEIKDGRMYVVPDIKANTTFTPGLNTNGVISSGTKTKPILSSVASPQYGGIF